MINAIEAIEEVRVAKVVVVVVAVATRKRPWFTSPRPCTLSQSTTLRRRSLKNSMPRLMPSSIRF